MRKVWPNHRLNRYKFYVRIIFLMLLLSAVISTVFAQPVDRKIQFAAAWQAGIRPRQVLKTINGQPATLKTIGLITKEKKAGDIIHLQVEQSSGIKDIPVLLSTKYQKLFTISRKKNPTALQAAILKDWLRQDN